ncbi:alpha/beta hydrolase [Engelhardtia mirabilis]|uniref:Thermostable monoacylglycerol lipase n=1 Tax=Engelhardtia mirabilis TaxID=2528011 RepID=A0A518BIX5_9BACT|nr:Thermostable monoacylglycerol lipase [Planctomycetes bacterium Pla133]QDV01220.1 Thermostable monoacylglycerol lipase [Planctomycetes bacterium Pla86]
MDPTDPTAGPGPINPLAAEPEGTRQLQGLGPLIAKAQSRRRRLVLAALAAIGLGLALIVVGIFLARLRGLQVLQDELAAFPLDSASGVRPGMAARTLEAPGATTAVLMVHGWCSGPTDFSDLPERLQARGFHVRVMRLPGHGTSPEDFGAQTAEDWRGAVRAEFDDLAARFPRVDGVGFSMGGALLVELAAEREFGRVAVLAPFFGLPYPRPFGWTVGGLAAGLQRILPYVDSGPGVRTLRCREHEDEFLKYRALPLAAVVQADAIGRAVDRDELLARVTEPLLVIAAPDDPVAGAERSLDALARTNSVEPASFIAESSEHILCWDCDAEAVKNAVVEFLLVGE